ncbi:MAG: metal-binding protein [Candidatus Bipolaricaulia bacterium]
MPSGARHLRLESLLLPVFLAGLYFYGLGWPGLLTFAGAYLFSSLMLSPDLDLRSNSARRRWGILGFIWVPYTKVFKHRGLSHNLLLGPLTRTGYLFLVGFIVIYALNYFGLRANIQVHLDREVLVMIGIGLYLPNSLHILYDHFDSKVLRGQARSRRTV